MKTSRLFLVLLVVFVSTAWGQQEKPPSLGKEPADQKRPTLGETTPGGGPLTSTTTDPHKLVRVRTVFIENIDNALHEKLTEALAKSGPFRVVAKRSEADALMRGTCFDSRRLKRVHSEVFLTDPRGASIWQDVVRQPFNPPALDKAVSDSASIIVAHLTESIREAQHN